MKENFNRVIFLSCTFVLVLFSLLTMSNFIHYMTFYSNATLGGFMFSYIVHAPSSMQLLEIIYILGYIVIVIGLRKQNKRLNLALSGLLGLGVITIVLNLQSFKLSTLGLTNAIGATTIYLFKSLYYVIAGIISNLIPWVLGLILFLLIGGFIFKAIKVYQPKMKLSGAKKIKFSFKRPQVQTIINIIFATLLVSSIFMIIVLLVLRVASIMNMYNY